MQVLESMYDGQAKTGWSCRARKVSLEEYARPWRSPGCQPYCHRDVADGGPEAYTGLFSLSSRTLCFVNDVGGGMFVVVWFGKHIRASLNETGTFKEVVV
jgi:hypothetical protein